MAPSSHDRRDELAVQHRLHAGLLHEHVGDELEELGVERVADRLRLRHRSTHRLRALLELDADALAVDRGLVPVPREAFDADLRDVAAKTAMALEQRRARAGASGCQCRRQPAWPAADDQHVGLVHDVDLARRFSDSLHRSSAPPPSRLDAPRGRSPATPRARTMPRLRRRSAPKCSGPSAARDTRSRPARVMPATLPTAFCRPIQRPVASGPAKVCVTEGLDGLLSPSMTPVSSSIAARRDQPGRHAYCRSGTGRHRRCSERVPSCRHD